MDAISELKGLSETADEKIRKGTNHDKGLTEWFDLVKQAAHSIANDDDIISEASLSKRKSKKKKAILPDILSFVIEVETLPKKKQRISSTLAHMQKDHISHTKRNSEGNTSKLDTSNSKQDTVFNGTFVKQTPPQGSVETPYSEARAEQTFDVSNEEQGFYTPEPSAPQLQTETVVKAARASLKRKSSSSLPTDAVSVKKTKFMQGATVSVVKKSLRKSLKGHGKISGNKFFKHRLPSTKISGGGVSSSILKENRRPKTKTENDEDNHTLKKVLAARQTKIQEAKKKREEKMIKTSQQRLKLEKEKSERLRCGKHKEVEKPLLKTVLLAKTARTREMEKNINSESDFERASTRSTKNSAKTNYSSTPAKTPHKKNTKVTEEASKNEKEDLNKTYATTSSSPDSNAKHASSTKTSKANIPCTPIKSARKVDTKKAVVEEKKKDDLMKTFTAKSSSPNSEEIHSKEKKITSSTKGDFTKTPVPIQQTVSFANNSTLNGSGKIPKQNVDPRTPLISKENNSSHKASILQSYQLTPARESFVNYDISEIKSDDSDEEEETSSNKKPVPGWASGNRLRTALIQQQYRAINTDYLFGNVFGSIQLCDIMGVQNKRYFKRTSSAMWNSPSAFK